MRNKNEATFIPCHLRLCLFIQTVSAETYTAEVWADNWFQFNVNGVKVAEDSVPITTERSFNAERFSFEAQALFSVGLIAKDFKENDSGLEYIGTRRQQMGRWWHHPANQRCQRVRQSP